MTQTDGVPFAPSGGWADGPTGQEMFGGDDDWNLGGLATTASPGQLIASAFGLLLVAAALAGAAIAVLLDHLLNRGGQ